MLGGYICCMNGPGMYAPGGGGAMPGIIGCQVTRVREILEIVDRGTYLSRVAIRRISINVSARGGLLVLLIRGRGHRRGLRRRHVRRLLLRLQRHGREHLHVPLALVRPDRVCSVNSATRAAILRKQQVCIRGEKGVTRHPGAVRKETAEKGKLRTDGGRISDLVVLEWVKVILDMH